MEGRSQAPLLCLVAFLLGLAGVLLCLVGPMLPAGAQDSRVLQVWPDRSIGVTSGLLEGPTVYTPTQVLPFGVYSTSAGDVVRARTYLHFPLDVFPPGTEILRAVLYVYVDSRSGTDEATLGVYRVVEPWEEEDWGADPGAWPVLLTSPVAVTTSRFDVLTQTLPVPTPVPTATPTFTPTPTLTATQVSMRFSRPAGHGLIQATSTSPASPLYTPTPPTSPLPTSTPMSTLPSTPVSTPGPTPPPPPAPLPTPTSSLSPTAPVVPLGRVAGTWLTWDVTALMRAWLAREVSDDGLALAPAPEPDADPETAGNLLVARWLAADAPDTRPYLIADFKVHPVTPTPTSTPVQVLPPAGSPVGWEVAGLLLLGVVFLILGLTRLRK